MLDTAISVLHMLILLVILGGALFAAYEYFHVYRRRIRPALENIEETSGSVKTIAATAEVIAGHAEEVSAALRDRLLQWLEGRASRAEERLRALETAISQVQSTQALSFVKSLHRGFDSMQRYRVSHSPVLLKDARRELRNGLSDLYLYVSTTKAEALLEHHQISCLMLDLLSHAAELEVELLVALGEHAEVGMARVKHRQIGERWAQKLSELGPLHERVLSPTVRHGCGGRPGRARVAQEALVQQLLAYTPAP